jgi:hypothetical protein
MKTKLKAPKPRNPVAAELAKALWRKRTVPSGKAYTRRDRYNRKDERG